MANPGVGNRFASANLNKSYGHSSNFNQSNSGSYGLGRGRSGGSSGGMVVLSRPRSSHKVGAKLSIPPPLNLPSLRKEHEKFDTLGTGSGAGGSGGVGTGARPSSSGMGWSKPSAAVAVEKDEVSAVGGDRPVSSEGVLTADGVGVGRGGVSAAYMPPSARGGYGEAGADVPMAASVEKASVLRGEDFPSLKATLSASNGQTHKQKESAQPKQKQGTSDETSGGLRVSSQVSSQVTMRPQVQSSQSSVGSGIGGCVGDYQNAGNSRFQEQGRKQDDFFPGPLPLVRLSPRSDWADDERDTSHGLTDRTRDHGYSRTEAYWDRDFDFPRSSFIQHKPAPIHFDRRGMRDNDVGKGMSNEVSNADPFARDARAPSREGHEGHVWRNFVSKDGYASQDVGNDRNSFAAKPISVIRETHKENKYMPPQLGVTARDEQNHSAFIANRDPSLGRRDQGYGYNGKQQWNNSGGPNNGKGAEKSFRERYASDSNRYRVDSVQHNMGSRPSFSAGNKGMSAGDHLLNFSRDKRSFSRSEKPYVEDTFMGSSGFDGQDPFSGDFIGVLKRKKDSTKTLDFHDPVRESFEAELERVQKIQEQERQRIIEEQERALEIARREEEERQREVREQEERQRRLEEEAREAAWRAEQEKLEAVRRAEELRVAREEEKQRLIMEEERRKQAAKQKLLELEERIARRRAESTQADSSTDIPGDIMPSVVKEREISRADDFANWEDGERMVERITNSASSESSVNRPFDVGSRAAAVRDGSFAFTDRGKPYNSWRRDVFENGNSSSFFSADNDNDHQSPRRDTAIGGRSFPRKDFYGGQGYMPTRNHYRGVPEPHMDEYPNPRGHRWNISGEGDPYGRNIELEAEFHENVADRFDMGWGQGPSQGRGRGYSPFPECLYPSSDLDELYSYGRSQYPARQPRVLPPPALPSVHRASLRSENEHSSSTAYEDRSSTFRHASQGDTVAGNRQNAHQENLDTINVQEQSAENREQELIRRTTPGCDSQSSLSVSSPPSSPTQLSHDDFDESRESLVVSGAVDCQNDSYLENVSVLAGKDNTVTTASSISVGDDEEWTVENNDESQEQEEYEEDVGYHEEDDVHEVDDPNAELTREFEEMQLEEEKGSSDMTENLVLGFDQGVEVGIPNDDYERSPRIDENSYAGPQGGVAAVEQESFGGNGDGQSAQAPDTLQHVATCSMAENKENSLQNHVSVSNVASAPIHSSLDGIDAGDSSSSPALHVSYSSSQDVPNLAGAQGSTDLPVRLQFGLFSGPSLIPSPIPALQIGSIQMPLQLHPQIGSPLPHTHASQPPVFQFGQLRYPSPMSQGILPLAPQSMPYVQSNASPNYPSSQVPGVALPVQDSSFRGSINNDVLSFTLNSHQTQAPNQLSVRQETAPKEVDVPVGPTTGSKVLPHQNQVDSSRASADEVRPDSVRQTGSLKLPHAGMRNTKPMLNTRVPDARPQGGNSSQYASNSKNSSGPAAHQFPGSKGRRNAFSGRNSGARFPATGNEAPRSEINAFQRRPRRITQRLEFRVRQTNDGRQAGLDARSDYDVKGSGTSARNGMNKEVQSDRHKQSSYSSSDKFLSQETVSGSKENKPALKDAVTSGLPHLQRVEGSLKRNISPEDDGDAPLQSGVVRVYQQPGIEVPSDEDDFIEVRSKRQMLNDRREQREKEIKLKSINMTKPQRKSRPAAQATSAARSTSRTHASSGAQAGRNTRGALTKQGLINNGVPTAANNVVSQPLAPIGTVSMSLADVRVQTIKPPQTSSYAANSGIVGVNDLKLTSEDACKNNAIQSSLGAWGGLCSNQPVMALTQTQLEEAMKPACFNTNVVTIGDRTSTASESVLSSSSVPPKDVRLSSATSPINSLLAGEKIQFGAVTSPTVLPPSMRVVSQGTRPSPPSSLQIQMSQSMAEPESNSEILFEKEKHVNESCRPLDECEAEAEAAASAVVVAAIGNDEVVGNSISSCSATISDPKSFGSVAIDGIKAGDHNSLSQSKAEETLSVSLPADLSVETPPISIWPPLPSSHSSSSQMLPPFPGGPTSHLTFYDMNPMMGAPVFAFGPSEESVGPPLQLQKNGIPSSGPPGTWQQCHTGVDSFYGPPTGFTAPFITPPGNIPGVQGPPHMVVYNHFAPVGQFGQVGLSYMGTTYVPSGKQPDWKHNPTSASMGAGEGEINNLNMIPVHRNAPPAQVQHLAPGSPLLSMASPMAMFEVSPFQSSPDVPIHPRWSHVQASTVHTIPQSVPLQQQPGVVMPSQFSHRSADHHPLSADGISMPQASLPVEDGRAFSVATNVATTQFSDELRLADLPVVSGSEVSVPATSNMSHSGDSTRVDSTAEGSVGGRNPQAAITAPHKVQPAQQKNATGQQHHSHYQRGQKNGSEWSNRKMGFHGRHHSTGGERTYPPKVKQIYVAKQSTSGTSAPV